VGSKLRFFQQSCFDCSTLRRLYTKVRTVAKSSGAGFYRLSSLTKQQNRTFPFIFHFFLQNHPQILVMLRWHLIYLPVTVSLFQFGLLLLTVAYTTKEASQTLPLVMTKGLIQSRRAAACISKRHVPKPMVQLELLLHILHAPAPNFDPELRPGNFRVSRQLQVWGERCTV
jgi:hypothetical protein